MRRLSRLAVDLSPLRESRELRLLLVGWVVSGLGTQAALVALPYQVYVKTGSELLVGLLGAVELVPLMAMALLGGAIADRFDHRRLLLLDQGALVLTASALAACMFAGWTPVAALYVLAVSVYGAGAAGTGLLYASVAAGGTVTALASGWLGHARRLGRILLVAVAVWGVAVALAASPGRCCWRRPSSRWRAAPTA